MQKPILLFGKPGAIAELRKAHIEAYTRKDGTFVAAHDDKRQAANRSNQGGGSSGSHGASSTKIGNADGIRGEAAKHLKKHVAAGGDANRLWESDHGRKAEYLMQAAKHVEAGSLSGLTGHLNHGNYPIAEKRKILAHVDGSHHEALGFKGTSSPAKKVKKISAENRSRKEASTPASKSPAFSGAGKKHLDQASRNAFGHAAPDDKYFT